MTKGSSRRILGHPSLVRPFPSFCGSLDRLPGRLATSTSYDDCPEKLDVCNSFHFLVSSVSLFGFPSLSGTLHT